MLGLAQISSPTVPQPPALFDQAALALRRVRAARAPVDFLLRHVAEDAALRLAPVMRSFPVVAEIGSLSPLSRDVLLPRTGGAWWRLGPASARPDIVAREDALPLAEGR